MVTSYIPNTSYYVYRRQKVFFDLPDIYWAGNATSSTSLAPPLKNTILHVRKICNNMCHVCAHRVFKIILKLIINYEFYSHAYTTFVRIYRT